VIMVARGCTVPDGGCTVPDGGFAVVGKGQV
jgi:hypothetical protein